MMRCAGCARVIRPRSGLAADHLDAVSYEYKAGMCPPRYRAESAYPETVTAHREFVTARHRRLRGTLHMTVTPDPSGLWALWRHGVCVGLAPTEDAAWTHLETDLAA